MRCGGGEATHRPAKPCTPVRIRSAPPSFINVLQLKKFNYYNHNSGVAQLVEQATVNRWVTGSSPVAGAIFYENIY